MKCDGYGVANVSILNVTVWFGLVMKCYWYGFGNVRDTIVCFLRPRMLCTQHEMLWGQNITVTVWEIVRYRNMASYGCALVWL